MVLELLCKGLVEELRRGVVLAEGRPGEVHQGMSLDWILHDPVHLPVGIPLDLARFLMSTPNGLLGRGGLNEQSLKKIWLQRGITQV